ncbi:hypothetical protein GCM10025734_52300 [Kitasatospora paranensis]
MISGRTGRRVGSHDHPEPCGHLPRQYARTLRYTVGAPRSFAVTADGGRVVFLRSGSGGDRANRLWTLDVATGEERVVADPATLLGGGEEHLSAAERARRERSREGSAGIVGHSLDAAGTLAAFALSGRLFAADLAAGTSRELPAEGPVLDPRPAPDGTLVAYATTAGALRVTRTDGSADTALVEPEAPGVTWGQAEFIAQEEMDRDRGYWWAPGSDRLLVARADDTPVQRWWIADPANPATAPAEVGYPAAGTPNAEVGLWLVGLDGSRSEVVWDRAAFPYLARVHWSSGGPPLLLVQARDQRRQQIRTVDPETGATDLLVEESDDVWLELFPGVPAWTPDGRLVRITDSDGVRALTVDEKAVTDGTLHVRSVFGSTDDEVLFTASAGPADTARPPGWTGLFRAGADGVAPSGRPATAPAPPSTAAAPPCCPPPTPTGPARGSRCCAAARPSPPSPRTPRRR